LIYKLDFSGPGGDLHIETSQGQESVTLNLEPGGWTVQVDAYIQKPMEPEVLFGTGGADFTAHTGRATTVPIHMSFATSGDGFLETEDDEDFDAFAGSAKKFVVSTPVEWTDAVAEINAGGSYVITLTNSFSIPGDTAYTFGGGTPTSGITVSLRGNGHTLSLSSDGNLLRMGTDQTLILRANLVGKASNTASLVHIEGTGSSFIMKSGAISGNENSSATGGGLTVMDSGKFTMSGGAISGNKAASYGGGVHFAGGEFNMSGGTIGGDTVAEKNIAGGGGGGVYVYTGGTFNMSRQAKISGNTVISGTGGGVDFGGDEFNMSGGTIGGDTDAEANSATQGGGVYVVGGVFTMSGGIISGNTADDSGGGVFVAMSGAFTMPTESMAVIKGNKATSGSGGGVYFNSSETFDMSGGTIGGSDAEKNIARRGGGVYFAGTTFDMSGNAAVRNNYASGGNSMTDGGGGVHISSGTFTMNGNAVVSFNTTTFGNGGGVRVDSGGNFTMNDDATVSGNGTDNYGGGVHFEGTNFIMNGGTISGNTSPGHGGGVLLGSAAGTFAMHGGTIGGGNEGSQGGGVAVQSGTFTMDGGIISGNRAIFGNGGGVYVNGGSFTKTGDSTIYGNVKADTSLEDSGLKNTATDDGHAVYVSSGSLKRNTTADIGDDLHSDGSVPSEWGI
jgi:hypothetical protein